MWLKERKCEKLFEKLHNDGHTLDKLKICMHEKIDIMIDDKPENLLALKDKIKVICYPAIWNEKVDVDLNKNMRNNT